MSFVKMISTLSLGLFVGACSQMNTLSDMHDSTEKMEKTTSQMNGTTSEMNKTTNHLAATTDKMSQITQDLAQKTEDLKNTTFELYDALRQGNTVQLRRDAWEAIKKEPSMFRKISEAGKYFMSFEIQIWNEYGQDKDKDKRDILAEQAAKDFFLEIESLAPRSGETDVVPDANLWLVIKGDKETQNSRASFNAMAVTIDQINRKQARTLSRDSSLEKISMLSLMEEALLAKKEIQAGTANLGSKEGYIREILAHEEKAIQILQTRYNFFPLIFIDAMTKVNDKALPGKILMKFFSYEIDLDKMNLKQLEYYQTDVLQQAIAARNFMIKIGVKPVMDKNVADLLKNMKIKAQGDVAAHIAAAQTQTVGLLRELQMDAQK